MIGCDFIFDGGRYGPDPEFLPANLGVHRDASFRYCFMRCGNGANFELFEYESPTRTARAPEQRLGRHHIAFYVDDFEAALAHLKAHGVPIMGTPEYIDKGPAADRGGCTSRAVGIAARVVLLPGGEGVRENRRQKDVAPGAPGAVTEALMIRQFGARHVNNRDSMSDLPYADEQRAVLNQDAFGAMRREITSWPDTRRRRSCRCRACQGARHGRDPVQGRVEAVFAEEFQGVGRCVRGAARDPAATCRARPKDATAADLIAGKHRDLVRTLTVAAATDATMDDPSPGARDVRRAVHDLPARSREPVARGRDREFGAHHCRVPGSYDDSVRQCAEDSNRNGWNLVADTNSGGGDAIVHRW